MIREYLITDINDSNISEFDDLKLVHEIRGRFIHLMSILERIMKEYCGNKAYDKTYGPLKDFFASELTKSSLNSRENFYEFVKALNDINPERNDWAHGFVYYKKRFDENANNFIRNKTFDESLGQDKECIRDPYFNKLNDAFEIIIRWLKKNDLWKIKNCWIKEN